VTLSDASGSAVSGRLREDGADRDLPVAATIDPDVPYQLRMTVGDLPGADGPVLTLLMFPPGQATGPTKADWAGVAGASPETPGESAATHRDEGEP
jgi:hypothetical protein